MVHRRERGCNAVEINRQAPAVAEKEIRIDASPADVWKVHADINGWHTWNPDISTSKLVGELSPGSEFNWTAGGVKITSTLQEVEESRRISWTGKGAGTSARHLWTLEADGNGTILRTEESMEGWSVSLLKGFFQKTLDKSLDAWLPALKTAVETQARS
jgi:uncharacterized protein YndB with AHSA1/START domain